jgi:hypothetical protein
MGLSLNICGLAKEENKKGEYPRFSPRLSKLFPVASGPSKTHFREHSNDWVLISCFILKMNAFIFLFS